MNLGFVPDHYTLLSSILSAEIISFDKLGLKFLILEEIGLHDMSCSNPYNND